MTVAHDKLLNVLFVGCGNIAGGFDAARDAKDHPLTHAGAYSRHGGFHLAACVEPDETKRRAFMARWKIPHGFTDMHEPGLSDMRFDVVSICSPTDLHAGHLAAAMDLRPRALFCEKPVTQNVAETAHWVRRCADENVLFAVNHTRRWAPDVVSLGGDLAAGRWGPLRSVTGWYNKGILNNGGHMVDLIRLLAGEMHLIGAGRPVHDFWPADPTVPALLQTDAGVPVQLSTAHAADYSLFELQLVTQQGVIIMENGGMNWRFRRAAESPHFAGYRSLAEAVCETGLYAQAMSAAVANLHGAVIHGDALASDGQSALAAQRICEQILHSALTHSHHP